MATNAATLRKVVEVGRADVGQPEALPRHDLDPLAALQRLAVLRPVDVGVRVPFNLKIGSSCILGFLGGGEGGGEAKSSIVPKLST